MSLSNEEIRSMAEFIYLNRDGLIEHIRPEINRHMRMVEKSSGFIRQSLEQKLDELIITLLIRHLAALFKYSYLDVVEIFESDYAKLINLQNHFTNSIDSYIIREPHEIN